MQKGEPIRNIGTQKVGLPCDQHAETGRPVRAFRSAGREIRPALSAFMGASMEPYEA